MYSTEKTKEGEGERRGFIGALGKICGKVILLDTNKFTILKTKEQFLMMFLLQKYFTTFVRVYYRCHCLPFAGEEVYSARRFFCEERRLDDKVSEKIIKTRRIILNIMLKAKMERKRR